ncbi:helix-turn-helix transcriptional regulator [Paenibacillus eucommiae]|uniref:AraC-like DNA-binding protein n=1 Tax=Paenibacillus eucommiae TaxID=1355755 RepID=A0ABS4ISE9_9BACL|nr:AraC family transcriptional regulator [Paenibacillus eucommiae]MBP1990448.1 AraC-like DNA-binding protein [Paenibacillus eucommiae]
MTKDIKSYIYKVIIVLAVVSSIPILIVSAYNINLFLTKTVELINSKNENELTRTGALMERTLQQIMDFTNSITLDSRFANIRTDYEQWKALSDINNLIYANPFVTEILYYNANENILLISNYGIERNPGNSPIPWIASVASGMTLYGIEVVEGKSKQGAHVASIVQRLPSSRGEQNYIIYNVNLDKIYASFLQELNVNAELYNYYLTDASGKIMFHREPQKFGINLSDIERDPKTIQVNDYRLNALNWRLISEVNTKQLYGDVAKLKSTLITVLSAVVVFMLVLILIGFRELYKPFHRIVLRVNENEELLRKTLLHRLLMGQIGINPDIERLTKAYARFHLVTIIKILPSMDEVGHDPVHMRKSIVDGLDGAYRYEMFEESNETYIMLFQLEHEDVSRFTTDLLLSLHEGLLERLEISIGGIHPLHNLHKSYLEAMYAYNIGRIFTLDSKLYCYNKLPMDYHNTTVETPAVEEMELAIKQQNERNFTNALHALFSEQITVVEYNLNFYTVISLFLRMYGQNSLAFLDELNKLIAEKGNMNVTAVKQFLFSKFHNFREYAVDTKDYTRKIDDFIAARYMDNFSLDEMADYTGISKQHLIHVCKKSYNRTPIEYLNEYRVEKAKHLLSNTSTKIAEIGLKIGFNSNSYFARVFKQYTGITPSEYRELRVNRNT